MNLLPDAIIERFPGILGQYTTNQLDLKVDWENSTALGLGQGSIYLNHERLGDEYKETRERLRTELEDLTLGSRPVLNRVYTREELYEGEFLDAGPDLIAVPGDGVEIHGGLTGQTFTSRDVAWTSGNHPQGMFLATGPEIRNGTEIDCVSIMDIAPTLLHAMDISVPDDMDGDIRTDVFAEGSEPAERSPSYRTPLDTQFVTSEKRTGRPALRENLEDLGYLG